jgi:hypothetical protein
VKVAKTLTLLLVLIVIACVARVYALQVPVTPEHKEQRVVRGAMHVHTSASHDGHQSLADIARGAKAAGLDFVVVTDHNQTFSEPFYAPEGVLVVPAVELSLQEGHVLALGMSEAAVDKARANLDALSLLDVRREARLMIAAHPDSSKHPIADGLLESFFGYELLSSSSDFYALLRSRRAPWLLSYPFNKTLALSAMYPSRARGIERYDRLSGGPLIACGSDDHGRIGAPERLQTYVTYLPTFIPERDARSDANAIITHLLARESYCALGLYGDASPLSVTIRSAEGIATMGSSVAAPAILRARWNGTVPDGHRMYLLRDGEVLDSTTSTGIDRTLVLPGRYRIELGRDVPKFFFGTRHLRWIYSNPIIVGPSAA